MAFFIRWKLETIKTYEEPAKIKNHSRLIEILKYWCFKIFSTRKKKKELIKNRKFFLLGANSPIAIPSYDFAYQGIQNNVKACGIFFTNSCLRQGG